MPDVMPDVARRNRFVELNPDHYFPRYASPRNSFGANAGWRAQYVMSPLTLHYRFRYGRAAATIYILSCNQNKSEKKNK